MASQHFQSHCGDNNQGTYPYPYEHSTPALPDSAFAQHYSDYPPQRYPEEGSAQINEKLLNSGDLVRTPWYKRKMFWIPVSLVVIAIGLGVGLGVGLTVGKDNSSGNGSSNSSNDDDAHNFDKDPNLHQSLWALAYTPQGALLPDCGATIDDVIKDIQTMSQVTKRIRLYGSDCNQSDLVLDAIKRTKVDMSVWLGIYVDENDDVYERQKEAINEALEKHGYDNIEGVCVGNEFLLNQAGSADQATSADVTFLVEKMKDMRDNLDGLGISLPVGTADAGREIVTELAEGADFIMANVHPFFGGLGVEAAKDWTVSYFQENCLEATEAARNKPPTYLAETGWPSDSDDSATSKSVGGAVDPNDVGSSYGEAEPGVDHLQTFIDSWVCEANRNLTESNGGSAGYFYFEAFDEPWKERYGGVEPHWGIFTSDRKLKDIRIPDCIAP